jgi:hypothetical protein
MTTDGSYSVITGLLHEANGSHIIIGMGTRIDLPPGLAVDLPPGTSVTALVRSVDGKDVAERVHPNKSPLSS